MPDVSLIYRDDGRVILPTNSDPAIDRVKGWSTYSIGLDLGRNDPTAIVVIHDECLPEWGRGRQVLGERSRAVVFHETISQTSYTDIAAYLVRFLGKLRHWTLAIDATGLGGPFSDQLTATGIPHWAVTMTAGDSLNVNGSKVSCAKNLLLENMASGFETGALTIADDLPQKELLVQEIGAFELATTSAGNLVLQGGGKGHHSDRGVAAALAYLATSRLKKPSMSVGRIANWH